MDKKILQRELEASARGAMVSVSDVVAWCGRSRNWVVKHVLPNVEYVTTGKEKLYFSGDVAQRFIDLAASKKKGGAS